MILCSVERSLKFCLKGCLIYDFYWKLIRENLEELLKFFFLLLKLFFVLLLLIICISNKRDGNVIFSGELVELKDIEELN